METARYAFALEKRAVVSHEIFGNSSTPRRHLTTSPVIRQNTAPRIAGPWIAPPVRASSDFRGLPSTDGVLIGSMISPEKGTSSSRERIYSARTYVLREVTLPTRIAATCFYTRERPRFPEQFGRNTFPRHSTAHVCISEIVQPARRQHCLCKDQDPKIENAC